MKPSVCERCGAEKELHRSSATGTDICADCEAEKREEFGAWIDKNIEKAKEKEKERAEALRLKQLHPTPPTSTLLHPTPPYSTRDAARRALAPSGARVATPAFQAARPVNGEGLARAQAKLKKITTLRRLLEEPPPPREYRVENLLPVGGCLMIAAPPKQGKTFFALELARAVATGTPFLGQFPTRQGRVLIVDEENGTITLYDRLSKLWQGSDHAPEDAEHVSLLIKDGLLLDTPDGAGFLGVAIEELHPAVIILDSAVRLMQGDENAASDVRKVFESFTGLLEEGLSVVLLHHNAKTTRGGRGRTERVRGSGDWAAMIDVLLWVEKQKNGFQAGVAEHRHMDTAHLANFHVSLTETEQGYLLRHSGITAQERSAPERALDALLEWGREHCLKDSWQRKTALDAILARGHSRDAFNRALDLGEKDSLLVNCGLGQWQFMPGVIIVEERIV